MTPRNDRSLASRLRLAFGIAINVAGLAAMATHVAPLLGA